MQSSGENINRVIIPEGLKERGGRTAHLARNPDNQGINFQVIVRYGDMKYLRAATRQYITNTFGVHVPVIRNQGFSSDAKMWRDFKNWFPEDKDLIRDSRIQEITHRNPFITETKDDILSDGEVFHIFARLARDEKNNIPLTLRQTDQNKKTINGNGQEELLVDFFSRIFKKTVLLGDIDVSGADEYEG